MTFFVGDFNLSNIFVTSNVFSNISNSLVNYNNLINTPWINSENIIYDNNIDKIGIGTKNPRYKLDVNGTINTTQVISCNISTSNLSVFGDTTILNTTVYQTEQLQVVNDTTATSMIIRQVNVNQNVAEFYNNSNNLSLVINNNGFIGIGTTNPQNKLDVIGNINSTEILKGGVNLSNIFVTSNVLQTNTTVNYDNLQNKPWINSQPNIIYNISANVGISTNAPITTLDVGLGTIKTTRLSNNADLNISASGGRRLGL